MAKQNINIGTSANSGNGDQLRVAFTKINNNFTELYTALGLNENGLNLANFEFTNSTISTTDSSSITINQTLNLTSDLIVSGDIVPSADNLYDLGKPNKQFRSLYVSDSTIYIGGNALSIDNDGDLSFNNNKLAHENGEFIALDNLIDVNATAPDAGDTIAWSGSQYVNVPLIQDRLAHNGDEVVLVGGANPYVTFPAITGGDQLQISGAEIVATSGNLALTGQNDVTIITNADGVGGGSNYFTFGANSTLMFPDGSLALTDSVLDNGLDADIKGSVFGDDSSVIVDAINRTLHSVLVNTLQLNFNISGDNIVAPTGGYITIGNSDGVGGVNNVATFDAGGIVFAQDVNMGVGKKIQSASGDELQLVSATNMGDYTWTFNASGALLFPSIPAGDHYEQIVIGGAEILAQDSLILLESFNDLVRIVANAQGPAKNWTFDTAGDLTLPGNLQSNGNINIEINLADSTKRIWRFGEDGELTFPDGTSQSTAGISASSTNTLTNKTINIQAGQGNVFQIQGNSITSYSGSGAVLALTSMPTFSGMNVNNSSLSIDGGSGSYYWAPTFADGAGTIHKAGVYKSANNANNALFTFGANGAGTMSVVMDGSLFVGSALPANNGGLNTDYGGWLVVQAGAKFGGDLNTIGNFILDTPGNYVRFGDGTTQTTAADFGYLDLDKDTIKGTAGYQYTFATDGYFTGSTNSESLSYFFVTYNTTNANIAAGWTVVGGTANTTVSSVTYPVAGYPGVIQVNLTQPAASTAGFYPVTVTSPDRLRVEIQPNPGTSDKFAFTTSGLTFPDATVQTTAYTGTANLATVARNIESEGDVNIRVNLTDSTTRIWRFGEDGDLAFPDGTTQTTAFEGNAATVDITNTNGIDTNYSITFVETRDATQILRGDVDLTFNSATNLLTVGNVAIKQTLTGGMDDGGDFIITSQSNPDRNNACNIGIYPGGATGTASEAGFVSITGGGSDVVGLAGGDVYIRGGAHTNGGVGGTIKVQSILKIDDGVHEKFQRKSNATGTVEHDCSGGHIFYHQTPNANWTVNLTNLNLASDYATTITLVIEQGATGRIPSAVQVGGNAVPLIWQANTTPTPSNSRIDVVTFSILYDGLYTVLGQLTGF